VEVLWWLVPPLAATALAMAWAAWRGRSRDDVRRESSDEALARLGSALAQPLPRKKVTARASVADDPTHGVAVRRGTVPAPDQPARR
jgi:predicted DNA-binding transcriptional regulator YafY